MSGFLLVTHREMTIDGLIYPPGAVVPAGVIEPRQLSHLRDSGWIIEVRAEEVLDRPLPHRVSRVDDLDILRAKNLVAERERELVRARADLRGLEAIRAEDMAPIPEAEPETRGTTADFDVPHVDPAAALVLPVTEQVETRRRSTKKEAEKEPELAGTSLPDFLN